MNHLKLLLLFTIVFTFVSCEKEQTEQENFIGIKKKAPHQSNHICLYQPGNNDLSEADERHRTFPEDFLYYIPVSESGCFNIFLWPECGESYIQAGLDAVAAFNEIPNTRLNLNIVNNLNDSDIFFLCSDFGHGDTGAAGSASIVFGKIRVYLNTARETTNEFCVPPSPLNQCHLQFIAMHEIGHALGLDHTDSPTSPLIEGTPEDDFFSVFNSGTMPNALCAGLCAFTEEDINAIQTLYPSCGGSHSGSSSTPGYQIYPQVPFTLCPSAGQLVTVSVQAMDVPNRFRVIDSGAGTVVSSGWIGYTNLPGPWGQSLNGPSTAQLTFTSTGGSFNLEVETVVHLEGMSDAWEASISCGG